MQTEKSPLQTPQSPLPNSPWLKTWFEILHLKQLFRKGWLERGIAPAQCETVAEHTFGNAMLCLLLGQQQPELNLEKVLRMALIHDLGEVYVGDLTPQDNVQKTEKYPLEKAAMTQILRDLPGSQTLMENWEEYEAQETAEARFVKQIDRLEFALQAAHFDQSGLIEGKDLLLKVGTQISDTPEIAPFADVFSEGTL